MAYKSLIDYYGGGMVKPSDGYQLGGLISKAGRQRGYTREYKNIKDLAEQAAKRKEKVGGNWLRKLAVGTAGTLLGGPMGGGAALALDQALREKKFKKTDFGGGKYWQDTRGELGKQEKAFKEKGLSRVGIAGVEGYLGGKGGGTFGKSASFLKGLPTDISMISGAMKGAGGASFLEAAKGVGWDIPSMLGGKASMVGSLLPSVEPKATNAPSFYGNTTDEQDFQQWSGMTGAPAQDFSYENIPSQYKLSESEWAVPPTGVEGMFAEEQAARIAGRQKPDQAAVTQPLTSIQRGDILGNEYMERVRAAEANRPLTQPEAPVIDMGVEGPEMLGDLPLSQGPPAPFAGLPPQTEMAGGLPIQEDWYGEPEWAGGFKGGGLVDYMMPQNYQEGGYATATDPLQALEQMGMGDVASDPALKEHMEDLPQFGMGYKQQLGDVTAGGQAGLMDISQQARTQQAGTGFAGGGAGAVGQALARKKLERGVATGRRGVVEGYQADLLSALADIEQKIGGDFTFGDGAGSGFQGAVEGVQAAITQAGLGAAEQQATGASVANAPQNPGSGQEWTNANGVAMMWSDNQNNWIPAEQWNYYAQSQPGWA